MNHALQIKPKQLPDDPTRLTEINLIASEFIAAAILKVKRIDKLGDALGERKKLVKEGQRIFILMTEVNIKIGEFSEQLKQSTGKDGVEPKWKRLGLKSKVELNIANKIKKHRDKIQETIDEAIENDEIPTVYKFRKKLEKTNHYRHTSNTKQEIINQLKKINSKILNMSLKKDEYFLSKAETIVDNIANEIEKIEIENELLGDGPTKKDKKIVKKMVYDQLFNKLLTKIFTIKKDDDFLDKAKEAINGISKAIKDVKTISDWKESGEVTVEKNYKLL